MENVDKTMSISPPRADLNQASQAPNRATGASIGTSSASSSSAPSVSGDTVTFTNTVTEMLKLEKNLANIPDVDNARVSAIKLSIAEGSYQINPDKIVDGLLDIEKTFS